MRNSASTIAGLILCIIRFLLTVTYSDNYVRVNHHNSYHNDKPNNEDDNSNYNYTYNNYSDDNSVC